MGKSNVFGMILLSSILIMSVLVIVVGVYELPSSEEVRLKNLSLNVCDKPFHLNRDKEHNICWVFESVGHGGTTFNIPCEVVRECEKKREKHG